MTNCVVYKPGKCYPPQAASAEVWFDTLVLKPGSGNFLDDSQLARLTGHPDYSRYLGWGAIEVLATEAPALELEPSEAASDNTPAPAVSYPANLSGISVDKAEDIVNDCDDLAVLRTWFDAETRKTLREILTRRIDEILGQ